jgi:hypothetical protein
VAKALAVLVDAAHEVSQPSYAMIVLNQLMPAAVANSFKNPHDGTANADGDLRTAYFEHEAKISDFLNKLDVRIAEHNVEELARMHKRRRMGRGAIDRKGKTWNDFIPYIREAHKPVEGVMDLGKAMLAYYVYITQILSWSRSISGPRDKFREEVLQLESKLREQFTNEYGNRIV